MPRPMIAWLAGALFASAAGAQSVNEDPHLWLEDVAGDKALAFREANTRRVDTWAEFEEAFAGDGGGGFIVAHWDGTVETEDAISEKTKATIRCIPLTQIGRAHV